MITFITDRRPGEPDILSPYRNAPLRIVCEQEYTLYYLHPPRTGWTHARLERLSRSITIPDETIANAYLDDLWIGGTEV